MLSNFWKMPYMLFSLDFCIYSEPVYKSTSVERLCVCIKWYIINRITEDGPLNFA